MKTGLRRLTWAAHVLLQVLPLAYLAFDAAAVIFQQMQNGPAYARGRLAISESQARWDLAQYGGALLITLAVFKPSWRWAAYLYFLLTALVLYAATAAARLAFDAPTLLLFCAAISCVATSAILTGRLRSKET